MLEIGTSRSLNMPAKKVSALGRRWIKAVGAVGAVSWSSCVDNFSGRREDAQGYKRVLVRNLSMTVGANLWVALDEE